MTQVGVIVKIIELISDLLSPSEVKRIFNTDEQLSSVLVEGVSNTGLILKNTI